LLLSIANSAEHVKSFPFLTRILSNNAIVPPRPQRHSEIDQKGVAVKWNDWRSNRRQQRRGKQDEIEETNLNKECSPAVLFAVASARSPTSETQAVPTTMATETPLRRRNFALKRLVPASIGGVPTSPSIESSSFPSRNDREISGGSGERQAKKQELEVASHVEPRSDRSLLDNEVLAEAMNTAATSSSNFTSTAVFNAAKFNKKKLYPRRTVVTTAADLQHCVLDRGVPLKSVQVRIPGPPSSTEATTDSSRSRWDAQQLQQHDVVQLMARRFHSLSTPGHRTANDTAVLALAMEGGGMRGAVSAGMAAALCMLGLTDTIDSVYGSSAGSVVGAYMVSRQMCLDVYADVLPASQRTFVCTQRIFRAVVRNAVDLALSQTLAATQKTRGRGKDNGIANTLIKSQSQPGMNISFVLDGIMDHETGIRPLDMERFRLNDQSQPLRIVSSGVTSDGQLVTKCFGTLDFFPGDGNQAIARRADGSREGIYACLEASMSVPGATGPPVEMIVGSNGKSGNSSMRGVFFDAFCFEPLPYRTAVEEGASHVLVLCSRPDGYQPVTTPGVYEQVVAPLYFHSHNQSGVAKFFENGGQQYIYAEDLLTLEHGKQALNSTVPVPPPKVLYGIGNPSGQAHDLRVDRNSWKRAHLMPLKVPLGTPELATLEQDRSAVIQAIREGFAAAFDLFAPAVGVHIPGNPTGVQVAEIVFPNSMLDNQVLERQVRVRGDEIQRRREAQPPQPLSKNFAVRAFSVRNLGRKWRRHRQDRRRSAWMRAMLRGTNRSTRLTSEPPDFKAAEIGIVDPPAPTPACTSVMNVQARDSDANQALLVLSSMPGLEHGRMAHLARSLHVAVNSSIAA
jgi:hypothetical protein